MKELTDVRCPDCGLVIGQTAYAAGSEDLAHSLHLIRKGHSCASTYVKKEKTMSAEGTKRTKKAREAVAETHPDVIVAEAIQKLAESRHAAEPTPMETLAQAVATVDVAKRGRLQKGEVPAGLAAFNARRAAAIAERNAAKAKDKAAKKEAKASAKSASK